MNSVFHYVFSLNSQITQNTGIQLLLLNIEEQDVHKP